MDRNRIGEIVREIKAGDLTHYSEMYIGTHPEAWAVAMKYLGDEKDSQDALQEAIAASLENIGDLDDDEDYQLWLDRITAGKALDILREKRPDGFNEASSEADISVDEILGDDIGSYAEELSSSQSYLIMRARMYKKIMEAVRGHGSAGENRGPADGSAVPGAGDSGEENNGMSLGMKIAAAALAAAIAAALFVGYKVISADRGHDDNPASSTRTESSSSADEPEHGGGQGSSGAAESKKDSQHNSAAIEEYRKILDQAPSMDSFDDTNLSGKYTYALVTMKKGEGPSLLLEQWTDFGSSNVKLYYYDEDQGKMYSPSDVMNEGVARVGLLSMASDGNGIIHAVTDQGEDIETRYTRDGNELVESEIGKVSDSSKDTEEIHWFDLTDTSALDSWLDKGSVPPASSGSSESSDPGQSSGADQKAEENTDTSGTENDSISGTYRSYVFMTTPSGPSNEMDKNYDDSHTVSVKKNSDGSITVSGDGYNTTFTPMGDGKYDCDPDFLTFDTSVSPIEMHITGGDGEDIYRKAG